MARPGTKAKTVYLTNEELENDFELIHDHIGRNYKVAEVLAQLIRDRAREIREGKTRRNQIEQMREEQKEMYMYLKGKLGA